MSQQISRKHKIYWIVASVLVLCICLFLAMQQFFVKPPHQEQTEVVSAEPTPTPTIFLSPTPSPTNTPTPIPTPTPFPTVEPTLSPTIDPSPLPTEEPAQPPITDNPDDPYPELYGVNPNQEFAPLEEYTVYLTFDDGPSGSTPALLDMLREEGVPATFFILEDKYPEILKQAYEDGHTLGVHSNSHDYDYVYWNIDAFLADFSRAYHNILSATGYRPTIFRFPGGSVNSHNRELVLDLVSEMEGRGFVYYDWNVTSEDASKAKTYEEQLEALLKYSEKKTRIIALMHDTDKNPWIADLVREYIHIMRDKGYRFAALDPSVEPIHFTLPTP